MALRWSLVSGCALSLLCGCAQQASPEFAEILARYETALAQTAPVEVSRSLGSSVAIDAFPRAPWWGASAESGVLREDNAASAEGESRRRGPAYPGDFWRSLDHLARETPTTLWEDTKATATNRFSLGTLVTAGVTGAAIAASELDDRVAKHYTKHGGDLDKFWDSVGGFAGSPALHIPAAGAMVLTTLAMDDVENYERSRTLLNALGLTGITTMGLKWAARTESPNGDELGWPSGHSSSSFCTATVLYHQHGPWVGVPLFAFATFVAYERVDARNHDLSDVVSGSLIGIAIGHAVSRNHEEMPLGIEVGPYVDPRRGVVGLTLRKSW
jgi:PAP2 superfamily protein